MGFGWTPWDFRPGLIDAANLDPHPIVLLFLHVPKCGGTSVRSIFRAGWHRTHWSLSNRPAGVWHSHRMLKAIHDALKQNKTRIFAEWHIELNFTFLPEFERHVRAMRPGIRYSSFTILRPPEDLVASNMAYWQHTMPANLSLRLHPEWLLFDPYLLNLSSLAPTTVDASAACERQRALCDEAALFEASMAKDRRTAQSMESTRRAIELGHKSITDGHRVNASARIASAEAVHTRIVALGCAAFVRAAKRRLAAIDHILTLDDKATFPTLFMVREGDLSFTPPPKDEWETYRNNTPRSASNLDENLLQYRQPQYKELARRENACSRRLYEELLVSLIKGPTGPSYPYI